MTVTVQLTFADGNTEIHELDVGKPLSVISGNEIKSIEVVSINELGDFL